MSTRLLYEFLHEYVLEKDFEDQSRQHCADRNRNEPSHYTIRPATPHFTAEKRLAEPTPRIAEVMACVVLTGRCSSVAEKITEAAEISAAKPLIGSILKIFVPIVLIIFQPPIEVPSAIAVAAAILTQSGTSMESK
jgi:hypothetical protein